MMQVTTVGIDLAKNVQLHGCDATGKAVLRKQLARRRLLGFVANLPGCLIAMEENDLARRPGPYKEIPEKYGSSVEAGGADQVVS